MAGEGGYSEPITSEDTDKDLAKKIVEAQGRFETERQNWETQWQEAMDHIVPRKGDINNARSPGDKRGNELFDSTAIISNQLLASALHSMLTNPSIRFFELVPSDIALMEDEEVIAWCQEVADMMYAILNQSNFQTEIHEVYIDEGAIGTACLFMGEHEDKVIHFSARSMKEIYVDENNLGIIDTVHRKFMWKPRQVVQEFGLENVPPFVQKKYREGCEDPWTIIHRVAPDEINPKQSLFGYKSTYVLKDETLIINKSAFHEFPYAVPRWTKTSGEKYGRGPGLDTLPDIKMVNSMMEATIKGAQKMVDPPLMVADDGVIGKVRLTPGGLTVVRPFTEVPIKPLIVDSHVDFGVQMVEDTRKRIRQGFFLPQIQMNDQGPQKTAYETSAIVEEQLRFMGPILGRQHAELLAPKFTRLFGIMKRRGILPPAPQQLQGKNIEARYSSMVARAQRMSEGQSLLRAMTMVGPIASVKPQVMDNLDEDAAYKHIMSINGVPQKIMRGVRQVEKIRKDRADAMNKAKEQNDELHEAEVVSKTVPAVAQAQQAQAQTGA